MSIISIRGINEDLWMEFSIACKQQHKTIASVLNPMIKKFMGGNK